MSDAGPLGEAALHPNVRGLGPSATLAIQARSAELARQGRQVFRLGLGQSPFPVPDCVVEALRAHAGRKDYLPVAGLPALREAVADYHRRRHGVGFAPEDVLVAPGSKELMFLLQVVYDGELLIPTPAWVSYAPQARIVGRRATLLPTPAPTTADEDGWRLTPPRLDAWCAAAPGRPRILILNYPGNPTGGSYAPDELQALAEVARRHRIVVLSDEIYGELHHRGEHVSIARSYPEGTIVSSGLSKWCGAGGWRLGTFAFPPGLRWLRDAIGAVASETYTSTSAPIQHAAVRAFQGGMEIERYLTAARRILGALARECAERLRAQGAAVAPPAGAFYLFPDVSARRQALGRRGIETSEAFCERLLAETGVATLPGTVFGRPAEELTLRLALVDFDGARAIAALEGRPAEAPDRAFLESHAGGVLRAVDALGAFLGSPVGE